jgi:signal transduction histidine kinase
MILRPLLSASVQQDYLLFATRFIVLAVFALVIFLSRGELPNPVFPIPEARVNDILIALAASVAVNILFGIVISIKPLRKLAPFFIILSDTVVAGIFTALTTSQPILAVGIVAVMMVSGMFRMGTGWGVLHGIAVTGASVFSLVVERGEEFRRIPFITVEFLPSLLLMLVALFVCFVWSNAFDENNTQKSKALRGALKDTATRLESMRERISESARMGELLNSTLDYEKILDACLDIGRLSARENNKERLICMVLLVESEEEMVIGNSRGLQYGDLNRSFSGQSGVLGKVIQDTKTQIISEHGQGDPELGVLNAFGNIQSVMAIPLRAEFATYGVLVFASTAKNAFKEDHIDTMQSLGTQAAIALKNATIIDTLRQEKERLVRIEKGMRETLTRDLHDIPTQTMSVLAMQLPLLNMVARSKPEELPAEIENLRVIALRFVEEMRYVMFAWRPLSLESQGLGASLEQLAQKMQQTYKQPMQIQIQTGVENYLNEEQQSNLFYLIEEAANNARKHAEAAMIKVRVTYENNRVVTKIADNGKGFDMGTVNEKYQSGKSSSYGMINMSDRAEHIKGSLDVHSEKGRGTIITVTIPVEGKTGRTQKVTTSRQKLDRPSEKPRTGPLSPLS